ncbi:MAG TPA: LuxR family transcriptional regulator [Steroidobacter sp.]|nr:LuxR family transcriptional regulator [Steroidobacter sp.]
MKHFDLAQAFIERCERARNPEEMEAAFRSAVEALGFRLYAVCSHVDPLRRPPRAVVMHNYPLAWAREFSERRLHYVDPVFRWIDRTPHSFHWDASDFQAFLTPQQKQIMQQAAEFGVAHGFTLPLHAPPSRSAFRASCSVIPDSRRLDPGSYHTVRLLARYLYQAVSQDEFWRPSSFGAPQLSARQRQCLELAAQGKDEWTIGRLLNLAECTVHKHIGNAKRKLGVATRTQAVVEALATRQISFGDVVKRASGEH